MIPLQGKRISNEEAVSDIIKNGIHCADKNLVSTDSLKLATSALQYRIAESVHPDGDIYIYACPYCGSGEYLANEDGARNEYCGQCGKALMFDGEDE